MWNIKETKGSIGLAICSNLLFLHAILGCDTTSSLYGLGKGLALKKIVKEKQLQNAAKTFNQANPSSEEIIKSGEKALLILYDSKMEEHLDQLRYVRFCQKIAKGKSFVHPESLPPTSAAAKYHSMRVYHQVQQWKRVSLQPEDWGWKLKDGKFNAKLTDIPPAHGSLLYDVTARKTVLLLWCTCK
jgi:hypothetical protein